MTGKNRFTLIELLVVVAIIGILTSILLPSIQNARGSAKTAVCLSNTKQLALAYTMYTDEHKGYTAPRLFEEERFWFGLVYPYHQTQDLIQCTVVKHGDDGDIWGSNVLGWNPNGVWNTHGGQQAYGSYALNGYSYNNEGSDDSYFRYLDEPVNPERAPIFVDAAWVDVWASAGNANPTTMDGSNPVGIGRIVLDRHSGKKSNLSFFDGSAKTIHVKNLLMYDWRKDANYRTIPVY